MSDTILVSRIRESLMDVMYWDDIEITILEIQSRINDKEIEEVITPFPSSLTHGRENGKFTKEWHIGRVKYFYNHPKMITPIDVDNHCESNYITGEPIIVDGHHRLIAAMLRNDKTIEANYSGLVDTLDWLLGKIDEY
jgi:hypothetical protein